jgi:glutathione peroxidase
MRWRNTIMIASALAAVSSATGAETGIAAFQVKDIEGNDVALSRYAGKVLLVVNVASKCGLTGQYAGLQELYGKKQAEGLEVLGFPANNFLWQEPGSNEEIRQFCSIKYKVTFPMFSKIDVKGRDIDPLYAWLTRQKSSPVGPGKVSWNFEKFVIGRDGRVAGRFSPSTPPEDPALVALLESELAKPAPVAMEAP